MPETNKIDGLELRVTTAGICHRAGLSTVRDIEGAIKAGTLRDHSGIGEKLAQEIESAFAVYDAARAALAAEQTRNDPTATLIGVRMDPHDPYSMQDLMFGG